MQTLLAKTCPECDKATAPLAGDKLQELQDELGHDWAVIDEHHLEKTWHLKNFAEALAMTNKIGAVADAQGHHPDIYLTWGKVRVKIFTHSVDGLTESDFILAAKIEEVALK